LAATLRSDKKIKGIKIPNLKEEVKNISFADDATHPIVNACIHHIFTIYAEFGTASGAEVNLEKTEIIPLGNYPLNYIPEIYRRFIKDKSKILGLSWDGNGACKKDFWESCIKKIKDTINKWEGRVLSMKGKLMVINTCIISKIWYGARIIKISKKVATKIQSLIFRFLWSNKTETIKRDTLYNNWDEGGIAMPNIYTKCMALYIEKLRELYKIQETSQTQPWVAFGIYKIGIQIKNFIPEVAQNKFIHNLETNSWWSDIWEICTKYKINLDRSKWAKTKSAKIYKGLMEMNKTKVYLAKGLKPGRDWDLVWKNVWGKNGLGNFERDFLFKFIHRGLLVKEKLRGLPNILKMCTLCGKESESVEHLFFNCIKVSPALRLFVDVWANKFQAPIDINVFYVPDFNAKPNGLKMCEYICKYLFTVWKARGLIWSGKEVCIMKLLKSALKIKN